MTMRADGEVVHDHEEASSGLAAPERLQDIEELLVTAPPDQPRDLPVPDIQPGEAGHRPVLATGLLDSDRGPRSWRPGREQVLQIMPFARPVDAEQPRAAPHVATSSEVFQPSLGSHLQIARVDHWFKNVFVLPGIIVALSMDPGQATLSLALRVLVGLFSVCLVASSNYVINELMDASFDRHHPTKFMRPVPSGRINIPFAYAQWIVLMIAGVGLGLTVSISFTVTMVVFWIMGCIYNIPPVRSKDLPYLDVLSEAINNPLRLLAGWFIVVPTALAPASLFLSYWMVGCYFMAMKRFAEYRSIADPTRATAYRKSFAFYTEEHLLISIMFYGSAAMLFFGAFIVRYRLELILSFPFVALLMATYLGVAFKNDSAVQRPERLYREPMILVVTVACIIVMGLLLFINLPVLHRVFRPTVPAIPKTQLPFMSLRRARYQELLQMGSDQRLDPGGRHLDVPEQLLSRVTRGEARISSVPALDPFGGQPPQFAPKSGDIPMLDLWGQVELLEGQDQIVDPQDQLQVDGVGPEASHGDLGHIVGILAAGRPRVPGPPGGDCHETMRGLLVERRVGKLGALSSLGELVGAGADHASLRRLGHASHDDTSDLLAVERVDHLFVMS